MNNDAMNAAEAIKEETSMEAHEFVEMGSVSEKTKGDWSGNWHDGGLGYFG